MCSLMLDVFGPTAENLFILEYSRPILWPWQEGHYINNETVLIQKDHTGLRCDQLSITSAVNHTMIFSTHKH